MNNSLLFHQRYQLKRQQSSKSLFKNNNKDQMLCHFIANYLQMHYKISYLNRNKDMLNLPMGHSMEICTNKLKSKNSL